MSRLLRVSLRFRCTELALYLLRGTTPTALVDEVADVCAGCGDPTAAGGGVS